jgi:GxxExxY protein
MDLRQDLRTEKTATQKYRVASQARDLLDLEAMSNRTPVDTVTHQIIGAAIEVHRILGPGLLEATYMTCLQYEMSAAGLRFVADRAVAIRYKGMTLDAKYRIDLLVESVVVVEMKAVDHVLPVHQAQLLTYMRLLDCPAGLLINFNVPKLVDGVKRLINVPRVKATPGRPPTG